MSTVEYVDGETHKALFRDRELSLLPPVGALIRFPSDKVWEVIGHVFDYHTNVGDLWVCVIVKPRK